MKKINNEEFNRLPADVREKCANVLKAYDKVYVSYEYGKYNVSTGVCIKAGYAPDHKFIGCFLADEVFTEEERMINYVESFHDYPIKYKGKRDYRLFNDVTWNTKFKFDENGNIVLA